MIELRKLTHENWRECIKLELNEGQDKFVASNIYSLAQAYVSITNEGCYPMPYAIYNEEEKMVGFIMMSYEKEEGEDAENSYDVWRFMIDKRYQGKGYGRQTMEKALDYIKTFPRGEASAVYLSYDPDNEVARKLYASLGFVETGEVDGGELIAKLVL